MKNLVIHTVRDVILENVLTSITPRLSKELKDDVVRLLDTHKAERIVDIDLAGKTDIADYMVIASAQSGRHASALADYVKRFFKEHDIGIIPGVEGGETGDWVLVDAGCIIFHIFRPEVREHYNLEGMWGAPAAHANETTKTDISAVS